MIMKQAEADEVY